MSFMLLNKVGKKFWSETQLGEIFQSLFLVSLALQGGRLVCSWVH